MKLFAIFFILLSLLCSCNHHKSNTAPSTTFVDSTKSVRHGHYWLTPKESFKFHSFGQSSSDTISIITCSDFVYFPFGKILSSNDIQTSSLKDYKTISFKRDTSTIYGISEKDYLLWLEWLTIKNESSSLKLFFENDPEDVIHSYVIEGQITDSETSLINNIKLGISIEDFWELFFDLFPKDLENKTRVIVLISCVDDIKHVYTFDNKKLKSIIFVGNL